MAYFVLNRSSQTFISNSSTFYVGLKWKVSNKRQMIKVVCAIIRKDNKILITQRSETMKLPLKWEFPGGKVENNEDEFDALVREIKEELSIDIHLQSRLSSHIHDYGNLKINLIAYVCQHISGDIQLTEHKNYTYVTLEELPKFDLADADLPIIKDLKSLLNQ